MVTCCPEALRHLRDCGVLGVREPIHNRDLERLADEGHAYATRKRLGGAWWTIYRSVEL